MNKYKYKIENLNSVELAKALVDNGFPECHQFILDKNISGKDLLNMSEFQIKQYHMDLPLKKLQELFLYIVKIKENPELFCISDERSKPRPSTRKPMYKNTIERKLSGQAQIEDAYYNSYSQQSGEHSKPGLPTRKPIYKEPIEKKASGQAQVRNSSSQHLDEHCKPQLHTRKPIKKNPLIEAQIENADNNFSSQFDELTEKFKLRSSIRKPIYNEPIEKRASGQAQDKNSSSLHSDEQCKPQLHTRKPIKKNPLIEAQIENADNSSSQHAELKEKFKFESRSIRKPIYKEPTEKKLSCHEEIQDADNNSSSQPISLAEKLKFELKNFSSQLPENQQNASVILKPPVYADKEEHYNPSDHSSYSVNDTPPIFNSSLPIPPKTQNYPLTFTQENHIPDDVLSNSSFDSDSFEDNPTSVHEDDNTRPTRITESSKSFSQSRDLLSRNLKLGLQSLANKLDEPPVCENDYEEPDKTFNYTQKPLQKNKNLKLRKLQATPSSSDKATEINKNDGIHKLIVVAPPQLPPKPEEDYLQPTTLRRPAQRPLPPKPASNNSLTDHPYYRNWKRMDCKNYLIGQEAGAFVLRSSNNHYATLVVKDKTRVYNLPVKVLKNRLYVNGDETQTFKDIYELISYYSLNPLMLHSSEVILSDFALPT